MPKQFLLPSGWLERPCLFQLPCTAAQACTHCEEPFGFWNRRRHCEFCGYVCHRGGCSRKFTLEGEFFRRRICGRCDFYRNRASSKLRTGGEFVSYKGGAQEPVTMSLIEETGQLQFEWTAQGMLETVDLRCVEAAKGFSRGARLRTVDYDPLRSFSLLLSEDTSIRVLDLRASSAWICQLWVEGVSCAKYVHQRMLEQELALERCQDRGARIPDNNWLHRNYLPSLLTNTAKFSTGSSSPLARRHPVVASRKRKLDQSTCSVDLEEFEELIWPLEEHGGKVKTSKSDITSSSPVLPSKTPSSSSSSILPVSKSPLSLSASPCIIASPHSAIPTSEQWLCFADYSSSPKSRKISTTPSPAPKLSNRLQSKALTLPRSHSIKISTQASRYSISTSPCIISSPHSATSISQQQWLRSPSFSSSPKTRKISTTHPPPPPSPAPKQSSRVQSKALTLPRSHSIKISTQARHIRASMQSADKISSTPGLPYLHSPLANICSCHLYEISPSKSFLIESESILAPSLSVSASARGIGAGHAPLVFGGGRGTHRHRCCGRCFLACRIALDLSNL